MKAILSLIISSALVVSGYSQTRNVLVGTNNAVVQPTNFWSADASNARTGLGLGSAATNDASAFQPASLSLSNLTSSNGGALTNLQATNLVGLIPTSNIPPILLTNVGTITIAQGGTSATNAANARQNLGSTTVGDALFIATNAAAARTALGATTVGGSVFTAIDAAAARTALSLGTASTNPASAFQPASTVLSNLANSNGASLTNISVSNVVGALSTNGNGFGLTNLNASNITGLISASNIPSVTASNLSGTLAIASGGTGATNAGGARTNLGLVLTAFTNTNADTFRAGIGLGGADSVEFLDVTAEELKVVGTNVVVSLINQELTDNGVAILSWSTNGIDFIGSGVKAATRTNLGLGATNNVQFGTIFVNGVFNTLSNAVEIYQPLWIGDRESTNAVFQFEIPSDVAIARTNLGLGWLALTNTTASGFQAALFGTGTNPVLVNTNGDVVSPTNFWQEAPITTTFIESQPTTNSSTNISPSRLLHIHSLATPWVPNVTNTIVLPTNTLTFEGDMALVVHKGPTNSLTQVRQAGLTNNLITLSNFNEAVEFTYYNNAWQFLETAAFTAPIYFSGTNAVSNAAESRTNLGLGATWLTNTNVTNFRTAIELGTNDTVRFSRVNIGNYGGYIRATISQGLEIGWSLQDSAIEFNSSYGIQINAPNVGLSFGLSNTNGAGVTRTNLGLGSTNIVTFAGLTNNGDIRINQTATNNGLLYIYRTNAEPFLGLANFIASNNTTVSNESLFRVGVAEATNKAAQFGFRSTNTNGNGVAVFSVFGYNALMMVGPSDPAAGTNPIQATIYSIAPTNKVMTLITTNTGATLFHRPIEFETTNQRATTRTNLGLGGGITTNLILKNSANVDTYMNFSNGILIYGSTTPP